MFTQIKKMTSYLRADKYKKYDEVPDPYFAAPGEQSGFELVSKMLQTWRTGMTDLTDTCPQNRQSKQLVSCVLQVLDLLDDACEGFLEALNVK